MENKEIIFAQNINVDSIKWLLEQCADQKKVTIYLNSFGGEVSIALAFAEYIRVKKIDLHVHVLNVCMSAAVIILCAGTKRTAATNSRFLLHPIKKYFKDLDMRDDELNSQVKEFGILISAYNEIVGEVTKKTPAEIDDLCKRQTILSTTEALELGLLTQATFETELVTRSAK
jgi:ATP-dependent protease ClpP protease subunit